MPEIHGLTNLGQANTDFSSKMMGIFSSKSALAGKFAEGMLMSSKFN